MNQQGRPLAFVGLALLVAIASCSEPGAAGPGQPVALKPGASVTVYPLMLGEQPREDVANVVGVFLERGGLPNVELDAAPFVPDRAQDFPAQAKAFGTFVAKRGLSTDYALFGGMAGQPQQGITEVRGALVDREGVVVWIERQKAGERAFDQAKPTCPMDCCVLLAQRLRAPLGLADPMREGAPEGKLAARMAAKAGVPPEAEVAAMQPRLAALRAAGPQTAIKVQPARVGAEWSADGAARLAALINEKGLGHATVAEKPIAFEAPASSNEQQTLWAGARSIQAAVKAAGPSSSYLLFTDFLMSPDGKVGAVHTYLVAPDGGLALVDFQNSHHDDFARIAPDSVSRCCDLAATRLAGALK